MKRTTYIAFVLTVCSIAFFSSCVSSNQLREGWTNEKRLKKAGYTITVPHRKHFFIRATNDSNKVTIKPNLK